MYSETVCTEYDFSPQRVEKYKEEEESYAIPKQEWSVILAPRLKAID